MPIRQIYKDVVITNAGGTIDLDITEPYSFYNVDGTGIVLANDLDITTSDPGVKGVTYNINYDGNSLDINGQNLTIFGVTLTAAQALIKLQITSYYDGSAWVTTVKPSVDTAYLESANIVTGTICTADLCDDVNTEIITIPVSFVTASQCKNSFLVPWEYDIIDFRASVTTAISGTDDGSIVIKANNFPAWDMTVTLSSALNTKFTGSLLQSGPFTAGTWIDVITSKTTSGGTCLVTLHLKRV